MASEVRQIQSLIGLPWIKPLCSLEVIVGIICANICARIFKMILNLKSAMEIGWNCYSLEEGGSQLRR